VARLIYMNGQLVTKENAVLSVFDHGLLYGDGVFEGIRVYAREVFRLEKHLERLYSGAEMIRLAIPLTIQQMAAAVRQTIDANPDLIDGYIRLVITRGVGGLGLNPMICRQPQVIIIYDTITLYPRELYENGLYIITAKTVHNHPQAIPSKVKSLNYLNNILAKIEGLDAGVVEALMLNYRGEVAEATGDNIFIVRGGTVQTPALECGFLEGITRAEVIDICREKGIRVEQIVLWPKDLLAADECFLTGTAAEVIPVVKIDGHTIGSGKPGSVTRAILDAFHARTKGR
jgi:branched-chain amino acid aminotransferase